MVVSISQSSAYTGAGVPAGGGLQVYDDGKTFRQAQVTVWNTATHQAIVIANGAPISNETFDGVTFACDFTAQTGGACHLAVTAAGVLLTVGGKVLKGAK